MTFEALEKSWKKGQASPVYVFHGEEDFARSELLHLLPGLFLPDEGTRTFNYDLLYGSETTLKDVLSIAQSYPVMAERRVVVVRDAEKILKAKAAAKSTKSKAQQEDPLVAYLKHPNEETILVLDMQKLGPKNQSPYKDLAAKAEVIEFPLLKEPAVVDWLRNRAKKSGRTLSEQAARLMVAHLGTSLRLHANELDKLVTFTGMASDEITEKDVESVVGVSRDLNIFELQKAIGAGNRTLAVKTALGMLAQDSNQRMMLFVMLAKYIEQLILTKDLMNRKISDTDAIADALELRGGAAYFVRDYINAARNYTRARLDKAMKAILNLELETRKSRADDTLIVETLVLALMPK